MIAATDHALQMLFTTNYSLLGARSTHATGSGKIHNPSLRYSQRKKTREMRQKWRIWWVFSYPRKR